MAVPIGLSERESLIKTTSAQVCPVCGSPWKELSLLEKRKPNKTSDLSGAVALPEDLRSLKTKQSNTKPSDLKIYNDDEPLLSPSAGGRFNPIPESDHENDDDDQETSSLTEDSFQGFFTTASRASSPVSRNISVGIIPETAVISAARGYETRAVVMEVKAPPSPASSTRPNAKASSFRAPIDLVAVVDISSNSASGSSNLETMKRAMRVLIPSLSSQQLVLCKDQALPIPNPNSDPNVVGSSTCQRVERLRCLFISARAVAESKRVAERNDFSGAQHLLSSARALLTQWQSGSALEFAAGLEAELAELKRRRQKAKIEWEKAIGRSGEESKEEELTPTSAWRTAERLARMRKSMNRVSDLHGFENARF